jgi:hypothetical protein
LLQRLAPRRRRTAILRSFFKTVLMVQILSVPIAWNNETQEPSGRSGGSGLQSRHGQMSIAR